MFYLVVLTSLAVIAYSIHELLVKRRYPPGPWRWPIVGNSLAILWREEPFLYFHELGKKYGGIFTFHFGGKPTVVVTDTALGVEGLIERSAEFAGRPPNQALGSTTDGGKDIAFAQYDQNFVECKRLASAALRKFTMTDKLEREALRCFTQLVEEWDARNSRFNPRDSLSRLAVTFGLAVLAGKRHHISDRQVLQIHNSMSRVEAMVMNGLSAELLPILGYFMSDNEAFTSLDRNLLGEFDRVLAELDDDTEDGQSVAAALQKIARNENNAITRQRCAHILSDFMAGSNSSVTAALIWLIYYAASYPHAKKKLQDEILNTLGTESRAQLSDRTYMPYTQAFVNESLRMRPIMPLALRHYTTADTNLGGHTIPQHTDVMFSIHSYHRDARHWTDPDTFDPDRWLTDGQTSLMPRPRHFLPFGAGARICPGETVARNFVFLVFVSIVQRYDFAFRLGDMYDDKCLSYTFISTAMAQDFDICIERRRK